MFAPTLRKRQRLFIVFVFMFVSLWVYSSFHSIFQLSILAHSKSNLLSLVLKSSSQESHFEHSSNQTQDHLCGLQNFFASQAPTTDPILVFGIPTVPRNPEKGYLSRTLEALANEIPREYSEKIKVFVVHNKKPHNKHSIFEQETLTRVGDERFIFKEALSELIDQKKNGAETETRDKPGPKVREQTRDIVNTLRLAWFTLRPKYYVIMEDDFAMCWEGVHAITYMIDRATKMYGNWLTVRFSYGFNGVLMHGKDLLHLADYLEVHQTRRPPDHLLVEWFAGETPESAAFKLGRIHSAFRYNILNHLGEYSTLRGPKKTPYLGCWKELRVPIVFEVEVFKPQCSRMDTTEDMSPCPSTPENHCPSRGKAAGKPIAKTMLRDSSRF